ncbi:putative DNA polymerase III subunit epsilon [Streptomyces sp. Tu6071]|uniref:3'-5' exonuclease n=1 Tax=Streptomyces sp. Tu6071 TaxID=355249 RepID=UPI00020E53C2|nr:3'-5' exonuclease [Streptomyces sp. Tu6071]EGJ73985.1 putative DNA polymerase III subunit epsilon [Streptomyces sp. Tu6071]
MTWYEGPLTGFDLETTGTDVEQDRIVTAAVIRLDSSGAVAHTRTWLLDPGVEIPAEATAIHGIPTARARADGAPARGAVAEITEALAAELRVGTPLVVMNARYDLSLLDRECRRHGVPALAELLGAEPAPVIDPLVLDKHADRYRRGSRVLAALCAHYDVRLDTAHDARSDALAATLLARSLGAHHPSLGTLPPTDLHRLQIDAAARQSASLQEYLRRTKPDAVVEGAWPVIPRQRTAA